MADHHGPLRRAGLTIAFLLGVLSQGTCNAYAEWMAPLRELSGEERMEMAVSSSDAIVIGTAESFRDSVSDPEGLLWSWMVFTPENWLTNKSEVGRIRIYFPQVSNYSRSSVSSWLAQGWPTECLVFLRRVRSWGGSGDYWVVNENPYHPGAGVMRLPDTDWGDVKNEVGRAVRRNSLEGLARRSPIIVVGSSIRGRKRFSFRGDSVNCTEVTIERRIAGNLEPGSSICVYTPFGGLGPWDARFLLMLEPGEGGAYETVGFAQGARLIRDGRIVRTGEDLRSVSDRLVRALSSPRNK